MSQYVTLEELEQLGISPQALVGTTPEDRNRAIQAASGEADSYIRSRYAVPLADPVDDGLKAHVAAIAAEKLLTVRGRTPEVDDQVFSDAVKDARRYFRDLSNGVASLSVSEGGVQVDGVPQAASGAARGFTSEGV